MKDKGSRSLPLAEHAEMDRRADLAKEFYLATNAELAPFVSDEATWYAFDYLDDAEIAELIRRHYGVTVTSDNLKMRFWQLLDFLEESRTEPEVP
ncbi:MAG TPA: hypothetical protein VNE42_04955 [Acidimicrobiales bacterium]|nr:hypothetical protein [Acidimicrobiales bacterium]